MTETVDSPLVGWGTPDPDTTPEPLNYWVPKLASSWVVKTGPGLLFGFTFTNTSASAQYVLLFDYASAATPVPADGAIPVFAKSCPANDAVGFNWVPARTNLVGIVLCNSSTNTSKTIGSANSFLDAQFL